MRLSLRIEQAISWLDALTGLTIVRADGLLDSCWLGPIVRGAVGTLRNGAGGIGSFGTSIGTGTLRACAGLCLVDNGL